MSFPVLDLREATGAEGRLLFSRKLYAALSSWGGCVVQGHDVGVDLQEQLLQQLATCFALPTEQKLALDVKEGGVAWRGYMQLGGERTHGSTDQKEGLYLGPDHGPEHPRVQAGTPLYGRNQLPDAQLPLLRPLLSEYIEQVTLLGNRFMELVSLSLGLPESYIWDNITCHDPIAIVRAFSYPPTSPACQQPQQPQPQQEQLWGIGPHTDYGLFTILKTDASGLEFHHPQHGWVDVPVLPNAFVCNVGDVLDRLSGGRLKSRPHRARNLSAARARLSVPFFFDPCWDAEMRAFPLEGGAPLELELEGEGEAERQARWDATTIASLQGRYSDFLAKKVSKVFTQLEPVAATLSSTRAASTRFAIAIN